MKDISAIRKEYTRMSLDENDVNKDPIKQFEKWFNEALAAKSIEPTAMNLATTGNKGIPTTRIVLLKEFNVRGFVFYTNYQSIKGKELAENPVAALNFFWPELERQVCIQGTVEKVNKEESIAYFQSRPRESQIGAWSSPQSTMIKNRKVLEDRVMAVSEKYKDQKVLPKPEQWGGYLVAPFYIEFWQGRPGRLHDRICYSKNDAGWQINRLAP